MSSDILRIVVSGVGRNSLAWIFKVGGRLGPSQIKKGECLTATTFGDIVTAVSAFAADYDVYVIAGLILGAGAWLMKKLIKAGR